MRTLLQYPYLLILSLWVGGMASFTFLVTPRIFSHFDRDTASRIVDALFPIYFPFNMVLSVLALVMLTVMWKAWGGHAHRVSIVIALVAVIVNLYILFRLYPNIMEVKRQVTSFVDMPSDAAPRISFRRLHAVSAVLNLAQLIISAALLFLARTFPR
jgi:hypothetical protein